ncbi:B- and T-lymphocyte attenuator-like [Oreochromis niloticus]|uniref:B- and T-lymphocyte attenuator-like n=2 Tax=Oreochromis TaxID=8139 RepID=A0A669DY95_ORENI|nr:B- and T-lymphocyte attenuator-like [Oreochromis niloticus]XP_039462240.1 B- and T-lymphocyte attenuator-like isoform X1 [Oreochromis aureus]
MTGAFLSIMRPNRCWTILHVSILVGLLLTLNAQSASFTTGIKNQSNNTKGDSDCSTEIRVRRNTVYNASAGQQLWINCPVIFCNDSPPTVTWYKVEETNVPVNVSSDSHIKTEWKHLKDSAGIFYLIFQNILRNDSGQYQCQVQGGRSMSHAITVNVYDHSEITTVTQNNVRVSTTSAPENTETLLLYVYSAAGIATFVIIVIIISVISMRGCKGKPKKDSQAENQYMEIPMVERPLPQPSLEPSQRGSPSVVPSRRSTKRKAPPRQPNELRSSRDNEQAYGPSHVDRERQRNRVEEESGSVVYAALNHGLPQRAHRPRMEVEETSEYAAIRLG